MRIKNTIIIKTIIRRMNCIINLFIKKRKYIKKYEISYKNKIYYYIYYLYE